MYNEEKKIEWMDDADRRGVLSNRRVAIAHFNRLDDVVESQLDEDIFDIISCGRKQEVVNLLNQHAGFTTYSTVRRFVYTINSYLEWRFVVDAATLPDASQQFSVQDFSLVESFRSSTFIKTQDDLSAALSHKRVEDGEMLPVFAALAWCGFTPAEMVQLRQDEVNDAGEQISIRAKKLAPGFVNDVLLYYSRTKRYFRGEFDAVMIKEDGPLFLRNIAAVNREQKPIDMQRKIQNMAPKYELPTGGTLSYQQLAQVGKFYDYMDREAQGYPVDAAWLQQSEHLASNTAACRAREYADFKVALSTK